MACKNQADVFGNYGNLDDAKKACDANPNCGKVCDKHCNGVSLTLCVKGAEEIESLDSDSTGACIYAHNRDSKYLRAILTKLLDLKITWVLNSHQKKTIAYYNVYFYFIDEVCASTDECNAKRAGETCNMERNPPVCAGNINLLFFN